MRLKSINIDIMKFLVFALVVYLVVAGSFGLFATIYPITALVLIVQMCISKNGWRNKFTMFILYLSIMIVQLIFNSFVVFSGDQTSILFEIKKLIAILMILIPFYALYMNYLYISHKRFFPAVRDASAVSFEMMKEVYFKAGSVKDSIVKSKDSLNRSNLTEIAKDIPRHSYTKYLNKNTLTDAFFQECEDSLEDEHLYIVISSTGSSSSELISVFTRKEYNHVSISFDRDLKTILSYNGGGNVYPPVLNKEQLEYFHSKEDASMLVYCLEAPKANKQIVLDKIKEINQNGSAYNLVGLVTKFSIRPNIMFCSQFVYSILRYADLIYFTDKAVHVKPSDFIERDYYRDLKFCYEIKFNAM